MNGVRGVKGRAGGRARMDWGRLCGGLVWGDPRAWDGLGMGRSGWGVGEGDIYRVYLLYVYIIYYLCTDLISSSWYSHR